jgi:DNA polymerase III delta prime subunit
VSRLSLIRDAQRPKLSARAMFQGPQGSGKTWTMLNVARLLATQDGAEGRVLGIDTERESMLTYADVFSFLHLPWRPPYSPDELTGTLAELARDYGPDDVVVIDSASHFWQGVGGILDIANGRVQGGWDKARPMQNALVEQLLAMPCHVLLGARMKNSVLVSDGGKTIENVGLTIIQDDTLGYELNVVVQMDMQHNATVMKSRTPAVPVGRVYPGGYEQKLAQDYAEWLAGGVPPANREDVERIVAVFGGISDTVKRKELKDGFVADFGMPHSLTADQVPDAYAWLAAHHAPVGEGPAADDDVASDPPGSPQQPEPAAEGTDATEGPGEAPEATTGDTAAEPAPEPAADADPEGTLDRVEAAIEYAAGLQGQALDDALKAANLATSGNVDSRRKRLAQHLLGTDWQPEAPQQAQLV